MGQLARSLAMWHAKSNFTHKIAYYKRQDHVLITTGIFAYIRHPSYFGFFWWAVGTQLLLCNPICILGFLFVLHRFFKDRIEEEELLLIRFFGTKCNFFFKGKKSIYKITIEEDFLTNKLSRNKDSRLEDWKQRI